MRTRQRSGTPESRTAAGPEPHRSSSTSPSGVRHAGVHVHVVAASHQRVLGRCRPHRTRPAHGTGCTPRAGIPTPRSRNSAFVASTHRYIDLIRDRIRGEWRALSHGVGGNRTCACPRSVRRVFLAAVASPRECGDSRSAACLFAVTSSSPDVPVVPARWRQVPKGALRAVISICPPATSEGAPGASTDRPRRMAAG